MTPEEALDPPILDLKAFERTSAFLPRDAITSYLRTLAERGEELLRGLDSDASGHYGTELGSEAHSLAGSAGLLGFARLAVIGRRFEHALQSGGADIAFVVHELRATIEATLRSIDDHVPKVPEGVSGT